MKHTVSIFSPQSLQQDNSGILEAVFGVPVGAGDGMSQYACRSCCSSARRVYLKLQELQKMAKNSYDRFKRGKRKENVN